SVLRRLGPASSVLRQRSPPVPAQIAHKFGSCTTRPARRLELAPFSIKRRGHGGRLFTVLPNALSSASAVLAGPCCRVRFVRNGLYDSELSKFRPHTHDISLILAVVGIDADDPLFIV